MSESDNTVWTLLPDDVVKNIANYVDVLWLQFHLGEKTIYTIALEDLGRINKGDLLVISRYYPYADDIVGHYTNFWQNDKVYIIEIQ